VCSPMGWELLSVEVACKSREMVAKPNNGLLFVTCCSGNQLCHRKST